MLWWGEGPSEWSELAWPLRVGMQGREVLSGWGSSTMTMVADRERR